MAIKFRPNKPCEDISGVPVPEDFQIDSLRYGIGEKLLQCPMRGAVYRSGVQS